MRLEDLRKKRVGEEIKPGDFCYDIVHGLVPAKNCVGRRVRPENVGYVYSRGSA